MPDSSSIAIITATFNAKQHIEGLANSLMQQTDQDFTWIVADGASTDGTVEYLQNLQLPQLDISSQEDFGIYDALNRGIKRCKADYYVVAGADDHFFPHAIEEFKKAINDGKPDLAVFDVVMGKKRISPRKRPVWLAGHKALVAEHAVGTLFKRSLHNQLGLYSKQYPIAADHDFILRCHFNQFKFLYRDIAIGKNGTEGLSAQDRVGSILESFRIQVDFDNYIRQYLLLVIRLFLYRNLHTQN